MKQSSVSTDDVVARDVARLSIVLTNVYAIGNPGAWCLVDAGLYLSARRIRAWAERHFGAGARPQAILLTHGHFDHVGALRELAEHWDVPVYAHPLEMPYLTGRSKYPPPDPSVGGGMPAYLSALYPRGPIDVGSRLREFPRGGRVPELPDWTWIHTPGHTAGHVSFFREEDRVLVAGDALMTTRSLELHGPPAYFTSDWDAARRSVERLAALRPTVAACGHGRPMAGAAMTLALRHLADNFDRVARPSRGRYARRPAVADESGVVSVPPPDPAYIRTRTLLIGAGLGAAAVWFVRARRAGGAHQDAAAG